MNDVTNINSYLVALGTNNSVSVPRAMAIDAELVAREDVEIAEKAVRKRNRADNRNWLQQASAIYARAQQIADRARNSSIASIGWVSFR